MARIPSRGDLARALVETEAALVAANAARDQAAADVQNQVIRHRRLSKSLGDGEPAVFVIGGSLVEVDAAHAVTIRKVELLPVAGPTVESSSLAVVE